MYLSKLLLNPRSKQVVNELEDPYQMHRTIMNAFSYEEDEYPGRVLFRVDVLRRIPDIILIVQSEKEPNWQSLLYKFPEYLTEKEKNFDYKKINLNLKNGQMLRFRLRANPAVKKKIEGKKHGKRIGILKEEEQISWIKRKARLGGFKLKECTVIDEDFVNSQKNGRKMTFISIRFEGFLEVKNSEKFINCIKNGIGPAKGLGFGLLSIAPA